MTAMPPPLSDRDGKIWMDGQLVEWRDAKIHVLTHTLHYGCGAFEGVRAYKTAQGTAIFRLQDHTERFFNSAKTARRAERGPRPGKRAISSIRASMSRVPSIA